MAGRFPLSSRGEVDSRVSIEPEVVEASARKHRLEAPAARHREPGTGDRGPTSLDAESAVTSSLTYWVDHFPVGSDGCGGASPSWLDSA